jgi:hypothetical protein
MSGQVALTHQEAVNSVATRLKARLPLGTDVDSLARAFVRGAYLHAVETMIGQGAVPSSLVAHRAGQMMCVSRELKRLVTGREIEVMLRATPAAARSIHETMKAVYEETLKEFVLLWSLDGARLDGIGKYGSIRRGRILVMRDTEKLDSLMKELARGGFLVERKEGDSEKPHLLYVDIRFDLTRFSLPTWEAK